MKTSYIVMSSLIMITSVYTQAMYVDDLNNYMIATGRYETDDESGGTSTTILIGGSYIFQGNFEVGVEYLFGSFKDDIDSDSDYNMSGAAFDMGYHIKNPSYPVNIAFEGAYMTMSMDADFLDELEWELTGNGTGTSVEFYKTVVKTEAYELIPFIGFTSSKYSMKIEDSYGDTLEEDDESTSLRFGLGIKLNNIFVQPTVSQSDGVSDFGVSFGMILSQ